ncbi:MAG: response regulator [Anaeromyxobacteraceae bacterium]
MEDVNGTLPVAPSPVRVLVVDDDAAVGLAIRHVLKPLQVTFAQSAAGALARVAAGGNFEAIVCDLNMPGMSGLHFHDEVARIAPDLAQRIVFITGGASPQAAALLRSMPNACVQKPFTREALRSAVSAAAQRRAARR